MAKLFGQRPSDVAILDECVGEFGRFYFDRGIAAFGQAVNARVERAGQSSNPTIAKTQRMREWERLMGGDMANSAAGFASPSEASGSSHGRVIGAPRNEDDDDETMLQGGVW